MSKKRRARPRCPERNCSDCAHCEYIGEGDFACMLKTPPELVKIDWMPTPSYNHCQGKEWEDRQ